MIKGKLGAGVGVSVGIGVGNGGGGVAEGITGVDDGVELGVNVGTRVAGAVGRGVGVTVGNGVGVVLGEGMGLGKAASLRGVAVGVAVTIGCLAASHRVKPDPRAVKAPNMHDPPSKEMTRAKSHLLVFLLNVTTFFQAKIWSHYTIGCLPEPIFVFPPGVVQNRQNLVGTIIGSVL
jgi:hypothetical protein